MSDLCPCGSGLSYSSCCGRFLSGEASPATAEELMRSRYCAYAKGAVDYLYQTSGAQVQKEFNAESSRKWSESAKWTGIEILATAGGGANDDVGTVEFIAHYSVNATDFNHHEISQFSKVNGKWLFIDGKIVNEGPYRRESPKVGRNDPCPCGSGKKYKKCCGKAGA